MRANHAWTLSIGLAAMVACSAESPAERRQAGMISLSSGTAGFEERATRNIEHERRVLDRASSWEGGGVRSVALLDRAVLYRGAEGSAWVLRSTPEMRASDRSALPSIDGQRLVERVIAPFRSELPEIAPLERAGSWPLEGVDQAERVASFIPAVGASWRVHAIKLRRHGEVVAAVALVPAGFERAQIASLVGKIEHDRAATPDGSDQ